MVASWTEVPFVKEAIGEVLQCARTYAVQADVATTPATDQSDAHMASSKLMVARSGRCTDFGNMPPHHCPYR